MGGWAGVCGLIKVGPAPCPLPPGQPRPVSAAGIGPSPPHPRSVQRSLYHPRPLMYRLLYRWLAGCRLTEELLPFLDHSIHDPGEGGCGGGVLSVFVGGWS